jgi:hypothetical protein
MNTIINNIDVNNLIPGQLYRVNANQTVNANLQPINEVAIGYFSYYTRFPNLIQATFTGTNTEDQNNPNIHNVREFPPVVYYDNILNTPPMYNVFIHKITNIEELDWNISNDITIEEYIESENNPILKGGIKRRRKSIRRIRRKSNRKIRRKSNRRKYY